MSRNWVAVASAEHVRIGRSSGFMQVCLGKAAPLRRVQPGDRVVYYSPSSAFRGRDGLQSFTAIGVVDDGAPYQADMGGGFSPFRRDVAGVALRAPTSPSSAGSSSRRPNATSFAASGCSILDDMAMIAEARAHR
jgi:hypothetical protein